MRVLFVVPPEIHSIESSVPKQLESGKGIYPKLGLLYVASYLEAQCPNVQVSVLDANARALSYEEVGQELFEIKPDLVGISTLTFNLIDAWKTTKLIKSKCPDAKVCLGGQHVTLYPDETLALEGVDFVVHGEGERTFMRLVKALESGAEDEALRKIEGLGFHGSAGPERHPHQDKVEVLDELPPPARHLIEQQDYDHVVAEGQRLTTMQTSRGCPAACLFCDIRKTAFRKRSPENVLAELNSLLDQGIDDIFFVDDTITIDKKRIFDLCDLIVKNGRKFHFKISARVDTVNPELLAALKKAGCYRIHYGVETATPRLLKYLEKGQSPEKIRNAFRWTKEAGIGCFAYMMLGIPTETRAEMRSTVNFAIELEPDYVQFSICTPYPKTALYESMREQGIIGDDYWRNFAANPTEDFRVRFWNNDFSEEQLRVIQSDAHRRFYGRWKYIVKEVARVRSWKSFKARAKLGAKILMRQLNR
ncbi:MAG: radical SAM protein [Planctomycetota bacterium]|nr:radical SAM protein [Planctomycetota bacterium]